MAIKSLSPHISILSALTVAVLSVLPAQSALITWETPTVTHYDDDTQVSTNGTFVDSFAYTDGDTGNLTVNGVTFKEFASADGSVASFAGSGIKVDLGTGTASEREIPGVNNDQASAVNDYSRVVSAAGKVLNPENAEITLSGLTPGNRYEIQIWQVPDGNPYPTVYSSSSDFSSGTSEPVASTAQSFDGKWVPAFVIGTFTADGPTQSIFFDSPTLDEITFVGGPAAGQLRLLLLKP